MTQKANNGEALNLFNRMYDFIENVVTKHSGSWHINDFGSKGEIETIRKALQADQWQDISTAPKDGTEILVACMFDDGRLNCCTNAMWVDSNHNVGEYFWYDIEDYMNEPTHWQHLPQTPKEKGE